MKKLSLFLALLPTIVGARALQILPKSAVAVEGASPSHVDLVLSGNNSGISSRERTLGLSDEDAVQLPIRAEVEGWTSTNPNTHLGTVSATCDGETSELKMRTENMTGETLYLPQSGNVSLALSRQYRGYEFLGFSIGEKELGKTPTLTEEQISSITEANPLVMKYRATKDVTLFYDDDPKSYRIPAIGTTSTGRLIAVSDYRHSLDDIGRDNHGTGSHRIDLVIRKSDDNGATWSEKETIAEGTDVKGSDDCAYGDAAIAVVGENVLVMAAAGDVLYPSGSATKHNRTVRIFSGDNGETWTKEDITEKMFAYEGSMLPSGYSAFFGSGKLAVDPNFNNTGKARIYGAMLINNGSRTDNNYVIYTDDLGETWKILGGSNTPVAYADEPKVEILPNGQILLSSRRSGGRTFNVFTYGTGENDKAEGNGTWNGAANGCGNTGSNGTNGEIFCLDARKADGTAVKLLLQSQPKGGSGAYDRRNVSIWYKEISAESSYTSAQIAADWVLGMQVSTVLSSYSTMSLQEDGNIAFFFEEAPCYGDDYTKGYSMVYVPLTIEGITLGNYFSANVDPTASTTVNVVLTDAQGNEYNDVLAECTLAEVVSKLTEKYPFITLGGTASFIPNDERTSYTYSNSVTLPFKVSNETETYWYNVYFPSNTGAGYPIYLSAGGAEDEFVAKVTEGVVYGNSSYNTKANEEKISWAMYNVDNSFTFTFKNKLTGKYMAVTGVASKNSQNVKYDTEANATAFTLVPDAASYNGDYALMSKSGENTGYVCSTSASYGFATNYNGNGHQGAWVKFAEAPDFDALIAGANNVLSLFGEGLGKYTPSDATAVTNALAAMQEPNNVKLNDLTAYNGFLSSASLNLPSQGGFYRISHDFGTAGVKYLQSVASSVKGLAYTEDKGASSIFYYADGKLMSYEEGKYIKEEGNTRGLQGIGVDGGAVTIAASPRGNGKYTIKAPSFLHANSSGTNYFGDHCGSEGGHTAHDHSIEAVTSLPLTIHTSGYSTFSAPVDLAIPEGVAVYYAKSFSDDNVTMSSIADKIPANTGVVVKGTGGEVVEFEITTDANALPSSNMLIPVVEAKAVTATTGFSAFVLATVNGNTGFYPLSATNNTIGAHKSYLEVSTTSESRLNILWDGETTGVECIEAVSGSQGNDVIYNLAGQKMKATQRGVNIVNGNLIIK